MCLALATPAFGQGAPPAAKPAPPAAKPAAPEKFTVAQIMDRQLSALEGEFVPAAEAMGHRAMKALSPSTLTERLKDPSGDGNPGPSRLGAASLSVWHSFDHYGQMVEYLRMNGIIPPASRPQQ